MIGADRYAAFVVMIGLVKRLVCQAGKAILLAELCCRCFFNQFPKYLLLSFQRVPLVTFSGALYGLRMYQSLECTVILYPCHQRHLDRQLKSRIEEFVIPAVQQCVVGLVVEDE